MLSQHYDLTEVEQKIWLHAPKGTYGPPEVTLTKKWLHQHEQ